MALDPEADRVLLQAWPLRRVDLPPGTRGDGWPLRTADVPKALVTRILRASLPGDTVDRLHREWWAAGKEAELEGS